MSLSEPLRARPMGERAVATMTASGTRVLLRRRCLGRLRLGAAERHDTRHFGDTTGCSYLVGSPAVGLRPHRSLNPADALGRLPQPRSRTPARPSRAPALGPRCPRGGGARAPRHDHWQSSPVYPLPRGCSCPIRVREGPAPESPGTRSRRQKERPPSGTTHYISPGPESDEDIIPAHSSMPHAPAGASDLWPPAGFSSATRTESPREMPSEPTKKEKAKAED